MNNEQFPAPDPSTRVEAHGSMQANPLEGQGVPGVEISPVYENQGLIDGIPDHLKPEGFKSPEPVVYRAGESVPVQTRTMGESIDQSDPRFAYLMARHNQNQDIMHAATKNAEPKGRRIIER